MDRLLENRIFFGSSLMLITVFSISVFFKIPWLPVTVVGLLLIALAFLRPMQLFWLLILAIPFSFEYNINQSLGTDFPDEILMMITLSFALMVLTYHYQKDLVLLVRHPLFYVLLLQWIWSIVSAYHSQQPILSAKYVVSKIWYIVPFVVVPQLILTQTSRWKILGYCIVTPVILICFYAMIRHSEYGFSFVSINESVAPIFRNHVTYAASLSIGFSVLFGILYMHSSKRKNLLYLTMMLIMLLAIYFSYTRGTWLSVLGSLIVLFFLVYKWLQPFLIALLASLVLLAVYMIKDHHYFILMPEYEKTIIHDNLSDHLDSMYQMKELSTSERFYRWIAAFKMCTKHPVVGFGPATFYTQYKPYTDSRFRTYVSDNPEKSTVHNYFLLTMVEQGFVGLIILITLLFLFYKKCEELFFKLTDKFYRTIVIIICLTMTNIVIVNFFSDMIETDKVGTFYFLCFGVLILLDNQFGTKTETAPEIIAE